MGQHQYCRRSKEKKRKMGVLTSISNYCTFWSIIFTAINVLYVLESFVLLGVSTYGKSSATLTSLPLLSGVQACGLLLLFPVVLAFAVLVRPADNVIKNNIVMSVYAVSMAFIVVVLFATAGMCLANSEKEAANMARRAWSTSSDAERFSAQTHFSCCGFDYEDAGVRCGDIPDMDCVPGFNECPVCQDKLSFRVQDAFFVNGLVGMVAAVTQMFGIVTAYFFHKNVKTSAGVPYSVET